MNYKNHFVNACLLVSFTSCSWLARVERDLVSDDKPKSSGRREMVPKSQYDDLLSKYEDLNKKYQKEKEIPTTGQSSSLVDELHAVPVVSNQKNSSPSMETVDVFAKPVIEPEKPMSNFKGDIGSSLELYQRATSLKTTDPQEALKIFQNLEVNGPTSIQVRAKFQIGSMFLSQGEFDLALQSFEDIITKFAHSGVVIDALKSSVICCEKLGLVEKKDRYKSLLNDVFEKAGT